VHQLQRKGFQVILTRKGDYTVNLDQRTTHANTQAADLFISIHANYAASNRAQGIETFCFDSSLLKNQLSTLRGNDLSEVNQCTQSRCAQSKKLAHVVHNELLKNLQKEYSVINRKVKHAVSQVLMGTQMPAILIELGFISHSQEAMRLQNQQYQHAMIQGICNGVCAFVNA